MAVPILSIDGVENKKDNAVTAIGSLVNIGDSAVTEIGFEYGKTEVATWSVKETGNFSIGQFKLGISGLLPNTIYYVRAFGTNTSGEGYSDWFSFTTENYAIPSGIKEEDETSPTICFYVRKVGGGWGMKHGPYTRDQADIAITQILAAQGKGKYQIKFTSDVLTGLSVSIMTKLDIKAR